MPYRIFLLPAIIILTLSGCSNEQLYTAIQKNRQLECQKLPPGQFESCMNDYDQDYEAYQRERDAMRSSD